MATSFIEKQFPVSKISKESYKERKAVQSQTLTGLGKWWGRKPLVLCRAAILGCLLPASDNPEKDMDIFLKLMGMDDSGLWERKNKNFSPSELYEIITSNQDLSEKYKHFFIEENGKVKIIKEAPKTEMEKKAFQTLGYDSKLEMCIRPENLENITDASWNEINHHLGTNAHSLKELVKELSAKRYGQVVTVGDCFCGGGSIPFEAARIGCNTFGSDLNPVAGVLTKASIDLLDLNEEQRQKIKAYQKKVYDEVEEEVAALGCEQNDEGDTADAYLYCNETKCPECGKMVPMSPSWILGMGSRSVVKLISNGNGYDFQVKMGASEEEIRSAKDGTIKDGCLVCPSCKKRTPISVIRHDKSNNDGCVEYGLRHWTKEEYIPRKEDTFKERLYAIRYVHKDGTRYYRSPNKRDLDNEKKVEQYLASHFCAWQAEGIIPNGEIESGYNTEQLVRERGWKYWHQLFNPRQLLLHALLQEKANELAENSLMRIIGALGIHRCCNWNSKLCSWGVGQARESMAQTFYNQAFNTMWNYGTRGLSLLSGVYFLNFDGIPSIENKNRTIIELSDARSVETDVDLWITDPPYADAVNYHELTEFFLAWDNYLIKKALPSWYIDSKRILAVRGDEHFSQTMIDIYSNLAKHMSNEGMQIVMFTHSDPAVWAQLALIMWKAGLTVTAAWNIATETDASGIKDGNYVKGTVLLILRKQQGDEEAFIDEITSEIKTEVRKQIASMQKIDDKEDPNFSDPDYVLAAYAASLKILTSYKEIGEIDLDRDLDLAINNPSKSEVVKLIERAKKIAYDCIIPVDFDVFLWKDLLPAERFYIKGLEAEKHGNYQVSTYEEYARGFGLSNYGKLMGSEKANTARLKTPSECAMRTFSEVEGFDDSILRIVLAAIYVALKEDEKPEKGLAHLKNNISGYWDKRDMLKQILSYISDAQYIDTMRCWHKDAEMAGFIYTLVDNDHI